jgi:hypothetical protein
MNDHDARSWSIQIGALSIYWELISGRSYPRAKKYGGAVPGIGAVDNRSEDAGGSHDHGSEAPRHDDRSEGGVRSSAARVQRSADDAAASARAPAAGDAATAANPAEARRQVGHKAAASPLARRMLRRLPKHAGVVRVFRCHSLSGVSKPHLPALPRQRPSRSRAARRCPRHCEDAEALCRPSRLSKNVFAVIDRADTLYCRVTCTMR